MRHSVVLVALSFAPASLAAAALPPPRAAPVFDPARFFAGTTHGSAMLKIALKPRVPVYVEGHGHVAGDGVLTLNQTVTEGDKPATKRQWTFTPLGNGRYAGTLSDAAGPVAGDVSGNRLHLHFRMKGGIVADQNLDLAADGASAHNRMTFRKFGIVVARLDETIRRG